MRYFYACKRCCSKADLECHQPLSSHESRFPRLARNDVVCPRITHSFDFDTLLRIATSSENIVLRRTGAWIQTRCAKIRNSPVLCTSFRQKEQKFLERTIQTPRRSQDTPKTTRIVKKIQLSAPWSARTLRSHHPPGGCGLCVPSQLPSVLPSADTGSYVTWP